MSTDASSDIETVSWASRILADLAEGSQIRVPLSLFYFVALRRDLEQRLAERGQSPVWAEAKPSVDASGRLARLVPIVRVEAASPPSIDETWFLDADV